MDILVYITIALILYVLLLSIFLFRVYAFFKVLSRDVEQKNLIYLLEKVIKKIDENDMKLIGFSKELARIDKKQRNHLQRVGYVRYNPFNDMGGEHSFSLTLLNDELDGIIITSLHSREMTRIYLKPVKKGKSKFSLSKEEENSLNMAVNSPSLKN